ncbi:MAG TPA: hypothetical protein VK361_01110 [Rubrobacteraceae bacterium]|nr:hypothetical protein [Rubrobacteraceae bacterium]
MGVEARRAKDIAWTLGQVIFANYNKGRFRTRVAEKTVMAGSVVRLRVKGITSLAPLAILSGRLNGHLLGLSEKGIIPYEESVEALIQVPSDAVGGTYIFLAQQWEPSGQPGYAGGSLVYASSVSFVEVRPYIDEETSWDSSSSGPKRMLRRSGRISGAREGF